ncbi:hypothetical protein NW754_006070 [Fusarium falciforme]|nr:hypothetical protein NW754_006070 [Fusarium falciforme]
MKLSSVAASVLVSASAVSASPIHKRELGGPHVHRSQRNRNLPLRGLQARKVPPAASPFYKNVKTFAPDGENFACYPRVYDCGGICKSPTGCTFGKVDFNYEHKFNISAIGWDTLFQSFDCFEKRKPSPLP